jgi:hypothetical protein
MNVPSIANYTCIYPKEVYLSMPLHAHLHEWCLVEDAFRPALRDNALLQLLREASEPMVGKGIGMRRPFMSGPMSFIVCRHLCNCRVGSIQNSSRVVIEM